MKRKASNDYNKGAITQSWGHCAVTRQGFLNHILSILLLQERDGIIWHEMTLSLNFLFLVWTPQERRTSAFIIYIHNSRTQNFAFSATVGITQFIDQ